MKKLTEFGKATLKDRYLLKGESELDLFERVVDAYAFDKGHRDRMYKYITNFWFMPSTPILSNGGTDRGLPISCYLNKVEDSLASIAEKWDENVWIASRGGGIGTCWSCVRGIGDDVKSKGQSTGVIPFMKVMDSLTLAVSQGSLRRGSAACYLDVSHPEIEEFLEIRKPSGDFNRKSLNLHHGILVSDAFMESVKNDSEWELKSPHTGEVVKTVNGRDLFQRILETRMATGEPYIVFIDTVNRSLPKHHKQLGLKVSQSNLCSEIMLPTGSTIKGGVNRTAVCCLGSVNLEYYDEWENEELFIEDCLLFLDRVLNDFKAKSEKLKGLASANYSATKENSVGLGVMGLHSYFQKKKISFESLSSAITNKKIFKNIRKKADEANLKLSELLGDCGDAKQAGVKGKRFSYMLAIAPTASISIIAGGTSPCIEPWNANIFTQKTLTGSFEVKNKYLTELLKSKGKDSPEVWDSIIEKEGSVQHLDFMSENEKSVFKTAFEINQQWLIELAGDRSKYIDQGQSVNLFLDGSVDKWDLLMLHYTAWKKGIKSLYYLRSRSVRRAGFAGSVESDNTNLSPKIIAKNVNKIDYDECLSCQ